MSFVAANTYNLTPTQGTARPCLVLDVHTREGQIPTCANIAKGLAVIFRLIWLHAIATILPVLTLDFSNF